MVFNEGLRIIGSRAFADCPLADIILPDSMEVIRSGAFSTMIPMEIKKLYIPRNVQVAEDAFESRHYSAMIPLRPRFKSGRFGHLMPVFTDLDLSDKRNIDIVQRGC